jgi:hypothetical protein
MNNSRRTFFIAFAPCVFLGLGIIGNACSDKNNNDAALLAAYQGLLASTTATSTATSSVLVTATATITAVSTTTSTNSAIN